MGTQHNSYLVDVKKIENSTMTTSELRTILTSLKNTQEVKDIISFLNETPQFTNYKLIYDETITNFRFLEYSPDHYRFTDNNTLYEHINATNITGLCKITLMSHQWIKLQEFINLDKRPPESTIKH
jgi:hypothetical protein